MSPTQTLDDARWQAVLRRDRTQDGMFVTGVISTGIYCRPSCAARHPRRKNVRFFDGGVTARAVGLRPCLRCRPDDTAADAAGVTRAIAFIHAAESSPGLAEIAAVAGYSPYHFHRLFKRATGLTPAAYVRADRAKRAELALDGEGSITDAVYQAGYTAPSRFYADAIDRLGMTPTAWRKGGQGMTIRWAMVDTDLGQLLVAATERGICRVAFENRKATFVRVSRRP